jgi:hypothetical protein
VRLSSKLEVVANLPGVVVPDGNGSACARVTNFTVTGALAACTSSDPPPHAATMGGRYDAFASAMLASPHGDASFVWAGREDGVLEVRDSGGHHTTFDGAGAQLAVGDLDQDGEPEIIHALDTASLDDAVVVRTWNRANAKPGEATPDLLRIPAAAGVHALAVCPPDGPGRAPLAVATADEIWVVR